MWDEENIDMSYYTKLEENIDMSYCTKLVQVSDAVWIIQLSKQGVCLVTDTLIEPEEIAVGIQIQNDMFELISMDEGVNIITEHLRSDYIHTAPYLHTESESIPYLQIVENISLATCETECIYCGGEIEEQEEVVVINDVYGGVIDPWVHLGDCLLDLADELEDITETDLLDHSPEIVNRNI